jgi:hypothetical protein
MRYSRLATTDESLDEYTPLMLTDQNSGQLNTADNAYLLPIVNPSVQQSFESTHSGIFDMLK